MSGVVRKTYTCELLTPMIMSGADQLQPELRAASFKGLLRWWWRALQPSMPTAELQKRESHLYGGVFGEDGGQKSKVSLSVAWLETPRSRTVPSLIGERREEVKYLAYGAVGDNTNAPRRAFPEGATFELKTKCQAGVAMEVAQAVAVMLTYGGFGMKSRNGFGQVHCAGLNDDLPSEGSGADFTSFETLWEHWSAGESYKTHQAAHLAVAKAYYISKNPREGSKSGYAILSSSGDKNLFAGHTPKQFGLDRKAKPVQLYVRRMPTGEYASGILAFPYKLSKGFNRQEKAPGGKGVVSPALSTHEEVVHQFMDNVRKNTSRR